MKKISKIKRILMILGLIVIILPISNIYIDIDAKQFGKDSGQQKDFNLDSKDDLIKTSRNQAPFIIDNYGKEGYTWDEALGIGLCSKKDGKYIIENLNVDGGGTKTCIEIKNSNVVFIIRNCEIFNSGNKNYPDWDAGIKLVNVQNGEIINNNIHNNLMGILLEYGRSITISGNTIVDNRYDGIHIFWMYVNNIFYFSTDNTIDGNIISDNSNCGINNNQDCSNNVIKNNIINNNRNGFGIWVQSAQNTQVIENEVSFNAIIGQQYGGRNGLYLDECQNAVVRGNTFYHNYGDGIRILNGKDHIVENNIIESNTEDGIHLESFYRKCHYIDISHNQVKKNLKGINVDWCSDIFITENEISENTEEGIYFDRGSKENEVTNNIIENNKVGIKFKYDTQKDHLIYKNYFTENGKHAVDNGIENSWDDGTIGNYWDDYTGTDVNNDNIGDISYNIAGSAKSQDHFPIFSPPVDFVITQNDIDFEIGVGETDVKASIKNMGISYKGEIQIHFYEECPNATNGKFKKIAEKTINGLKRKEIKIVTTRWLPKLFHFLVVRIDPDNLIPEDDRNNNIAKRGGGGNTPTIGLVRSGYGNWVDANTVGTFLKSIKIMNTFYANVIDLDGDVEYVTFELNGNVDTATYNGIEWTFEFNMGDLNALPEQNILKIKAYDKLDFKSELRVIHINAMAIPAWLTDITPPIPEDPDDVPWIEFDAEHLTITIGFLYPPKKRKPAKANSTVPNTTVPTIGDQESKSSYEIKVSFEYSIFSGEAKITGEGEYEFELFGYESKCSLTLTGKVIDWNHVELEVTFEFTIRIPIVGGKPFKSDIFTVEVGLAAEFGIAIKTILYIIDSVLQWYELSITTSGYLVGFLKAELDLGWVGASFEANLKAGLEFILGYNIANDEYFMHLDGKFSIDWKVSWKLWFIQGSIGGKYEWTFHVFSPEELNETVVQEPWTFAENHTNLMDSRPRVATDGNGNAMMVWTKNRFEDNKIYTDICYSVWDGIEWGVEKYLTFDKQPDFDPALSYDSDGNVVVVWSRITGDTSMQSPDAPFNITRTQEIAYSIWNGYSWSSPQLITNDDDADGRAVISAGINKKIIVVWVGDEDYNFTTATDMELFYSVWDGSQWSTKNKITNNAFMDYSASLAHDSKGNAMLCWIRDLDGNFASVYDRHLLYSIWDGNEWILSSEVTNAENNKDSPSITFDLNDNALITWVGGTENTTRLHYGFWNKTTKDWSDPEIVHEDGFFIYHPAINVDPNNTAVIVWRGFEDDEEEREYYLTHNSTETYFDGEICYAVKDLNKVKANWSEVKYLTSNNKTDWMASAVIIRGHSNDLLLVWDKDGDVSNLVHEIKPDLTIYSEEIKISKKEPNEGDIISVKTKIHNIGDAEATNIQVGLYDGDPDNEGNLIERRFIESLDYDSEENLTFSWRVRPGNNEIFIKVDYNDITSEIDESNNIGYIGVECLPDLAIAIGDISFSVLAPNEGDSMYIYAIIHNQGGTKAEDVIVEFYDNYGSIDKKRINSLNPNETIKVFVGWEAKRGLNNITVIIDPENQISEWDETNNHVAAFLTVYPDLKISKFTLNKDVLTFGEIAKLTIQIQNIGAAEARDVLVEVYDGNPYSGGSLLYARTVNLNINRKTSFTYNWLKPSPGVHKIYVIIDRSNIIDEINELNNMLYQELLVLDIPDLTYAEPSYNYTADHITINVPIINIGEAGATGIVVELRDGNPQGELIQSNMITYMGPKESEIICFKLFKPPKYNTLYIVIDPTNMIKELSELNNQIIINYLDIVKVDAGPDQQVLEGEIVQFSATVFLGNIEDFTFTWDFDDGNTGYGITTTHQYGDNGIYTVQLTVTGPSFIGTDDLIVTVLNVPPLVDAGLDQTVNEDDVVNFSGSLVDPGSGDSHAIEWDFGDGFSDSGKLDPNHVYPNNGIYTVRLTVVDDDGGIGTDTMTVTVENVVPIAIAGPNQTIFDDEIVILNASNSWDTPSDLPSLEYLWDFGDGTYGSGKVITHEYSDLGLYTVTLTIIDDDGASDTDTCKVVVQDDDVEPPELYDLIIVDDIHFINISLRATDESGIGSFLIFVDGDPVDPISQMQDGINFTFVLLNEWALNLGTHEVEIQAIDADNDRPDDALTSLIYGSFEISLAQMYDYVDWQLEELKKYIDENLPCRKSRCLNWKLSKAQKYLSEAFILVENGEVTCALYHDKIAKVFIQITEFGTEIFNKHCRISDKHANYIIDTLHDIRNNVVILMGASIGSEQAFNIAYIEVDLLNLSDFIEEEIPSCTGKYLSNKVWCASKMLEIALFKISMDEDIECVLKCVQWKLEHVIRKINWCLEKGRISEDLANYLIDEMIRIIEALDQILIT